jgi:hypothetical protein
MKIVCLRTGKVLADRLSVSERTGFQPFMFEAA